MELKTIKIKKASKKGMNGKAKAMEEKWNEDYPFIGVRLRHSNRIEAALPLGQSRAG